MKKYVIPCLLCFNSFFVHAQIQIAKNIDIHSVLPPGDQFKLWNALDTLLVHITGGKVQSGEIGAIGSALTMSVFGSLKGIENNEKEKRSGYYKPEIINLYNLGDHQYMISVAFMSDVPAGASLRAIFNLVCDISSGSAAFSIPLHYYTRNWKAHNTGNITYHYPDTINLKRAKIFDQKNSQIASKLGLEPEKFNFYLCDNYQDILHLMGYEYDSESAGNVTDGYGVDEGTIFSIMHNEDFSHDLFHHYSGKVRKNARNSAADEGMAYTWGNAYYTDEHGEMITQKQLMPKLAAYLQEHPQASLFELFTNNPMIFDYQTKVRSLISSLICDEVERIRGTAGVKELIDCGKGDDYYFRVVNEITGINAANFDVKVMALVKAYK